jgi:dimethylglycine dehydrogenase
MSGLDRFIAFDKGEFIGRDAALAERAAGPSQRLVLLAIDALDADVTGFEPVSVGTRKVGFITSGAYGHHVMQSLGLAYVDRSIAEKPAPLTVHVVGEPRPARILAEPPYDPKGLKLRG